MQREKGLFLLYVIENIVKLSVCGESQPTFSDPLLALSSVCFFKFSNYSFQSLNVLSTYFAYFLAYSSPLVLRTPYRAFSAMHISHIWHTHAQPKPH